MSYETAELKPGMADGRPLLVLRGELDFLALPRVREVLTSACQVPAADVVVDLAEVTFAGAGLLGLLAAASARQQVRGLRLVVCRVRPPQAKLFRLLGLDDLLVHPSGR